ncbi:hypothetical protein B484DRAFT_444381 [Ochromonadaceae sp. CCMP2298]|nr:hypothetical protein B484DRAFT_444381 [Ochromonadaceae sp. CCMP2298]
MLCKSALVLVVLCLLQASQCFRTIPSRARACSHALSMNTEQKPGSHRSTIIAGALASLRFAAAAGSSALLASAVLPIQAANAVSIEQANNKLAGYDLPPILYMPKGFSPLVSEYGRGNNKEAMTNPILVQFAHPGLWVVQRTSVNLNGEAGTISANEYQKGDSAYLFVTPKPPASGELTVDNKALIQQYVLKALSQKGDPVESLKIYKVAEGAKDADGKPYLIVDFGYQLNTEAGFLIGRRAILSLTSKGEGQLQGLVAVATDKRWRQGQEETLRDIANSFRVYRLNSGIFAAESAKQQ